MDTVQTGILVAGSWETQFIFRRATPTQFQLSHVCAFSNMYIYIVEYDYASNDVNDYTTCSRLVDLQIRDQYALCHATNLKPDTLQQMRPPL